MATTKINLAKEGKITSIEEALDASNLNFIAQEEELISAGSMVVAPDHKAIIRPDTNTVLGLVGKNYSPTPNSRAFAFMDNIVQNQGYSYVEAVNKDDGAVSIITAQSDRPEEIQKGDIICRQIKLINGFTGKHALSCEMSSVRLVCLNGMTTNERSSMIRFKHTVRLQDRMKIALEVFDQSEKFHDKFIATAKRMAEKAVDKAMVKKFLDGLYGDAGQNIKKKEKIEELFQYGKGNNGETLFDLYSGGTEFFNHFDSSDGKRLDSFTFGTSGKKNAQCWDLAMNLL